MADPVLHVKDSYYFEVPKPLWRVNYSKLSEVPAFLSDLKTGDLRVAKMLVAEDDPKVVGSSEYQSLLHEYNHELSGKILIPQPFGTLKNFYQPANGFCVSKFMILEVVVALIIYVVMTAYSRRVQDGSLPKGRFWNLIDVFLLFLRNDVVRPAIGEHDANTFLPFIWTMFFFVLGCNLMGMLPWAGSPTASFSVTLALAACTLGVGVLNGVARFGPVGYLLNQVPHMELPLLLSPIKLGIFAVEFLGLFIKHGVLGIRLLMNMFAGHVVLASIIAIAVGAAAAPTLQWSIAATIVVLGSAALSILELFVAFLQAYIFCFLSCLFIGAAIHHH